MSEVVHRNWGWFQVLEENVDSGGMCSKLKVLVVNPGASLSRQYHNHRNELWFVAAGVGKVETDDRYVNLYPSRSLIIEVGEEHRLINTGDKELVVYEVQYGSKCEEEDIVRL